MKKFLIFLSVNAIAFATLVPVELLDSLGLPPNLTDQQIAEIAEKSWFQNKERWEFTPNLEHKKGELKPIFQTMGYLDERLPQQSHYDYALVIGATLCCVQKRMTTLEKLLKTGITINEIVFLTGERPLLPKEKEALHSPAVYESDMIREVYNRSNLPKSIPATFIHASTPPDKPRPGTCETIAHWLQSNPAPGNCLIITNQPYIPFHEALLQNILPFPFDLAGEKASESWTVALLLDTIARTIAQEKKTARPVSKSG
jgi:hypothetical protein